MATHIGGAVLAVNDWPSNAEMIEDVARLGYLRREWLTLDATFGLGTFWKSWKPDRLVAHDIDPAKSPSGSSVDATDLPYSDAFFDAVVIDGPYKLNGNPSDTDGADSRYGVHHYVDWRQRMDLLRMMMREGARVLGDGYMLFKCQDQVCSGKVRWQTFEFTRYAETCGLGLVDRFDFLSYRAQPHGRRQVHARRNASTLLVLKKGYSS